MDHKANMMLCSTESDQAMGQMLRRYWIPILLASELPTNDCPPVRVKVLSERLLAFRDSSGRMGLIDEFCAHRGVSLWFGRVEDCGIRCPYHGWKFDTTGQCTEVPSESRDSGFAERVRLRAYPLVERGGVLWTYMGPPERKPDDLPGFEWGDLPPEHVYISKRLQECNWIQAMEGGIDSAHVSWLHSGELNTDPLHRATKGATYQTDKKPSFEITESKGGLLIGARRNADGGSAYWRITQWIMPWYTMVPPYGDNALNGHAWVPIDDNNCFAWTFTYHPTRPLAEEELEAMRSGQGIHVKYVPGTFRPIANMDNDYLMDRQAQKAGQLFSGISGIASQDASLQESMGPIVDRTRENLCSTDNAIIMARKRLLAAAVALRDKGGEPPGTSADCHAVRSAAFVLPAGQDFKRTKADALVAVPGKSHTSI